LVLNMPNSVERPAIIGSPALEILPFAIALAGKQWIGLRPRGRQSGRPLHRSLRANVRPMVVIIMFPAEPFCKGK